MFVIVVVRCGFVLCVSLHNIFFICHIDILMYSVR